MPALRIFQKSAHRIPTLALYKSLLKLSSSPILDKDLSSRLKAKIHHGFKTNRQFSARYAKRGLVKAFHAHATIEKAITGDKSSLDALREWCLPQSPPQPTLPPDLPSPPPSTKPLNPKVIKPPTIHYPHYSLPRIFLPLPRQPVRHDRLFTRKVKFFRQLLISLAYYQQMLYHLNYEELFLADLQHDSEVKLDLEAGVGEVKAMTYDMGKLLNGLVLMEDINVMWQLKEWLRLHPGVAFGKMGQRMSRVRRRELQAWKADVRRILRESMIETSASKFMAQWKRAVPFSSDVPEFRIKRQNALKRKAKKTRKKKLGKRFL